MVFAFFTVCPLAILLLLANAQRNDLCLQVSVSVAMRNHEVLLILHLKLVPSASSTPHNVICDMGKNSEVGSSLSVLAKDSLWKGPWVKAA